jgi:hypothetical protein
MSLQKAVNATNLVLGVLLMLSGLVLIALKVLILIGFIQVPGVRDLLLAPNIWDFLIYVLDQLGWLIVVWLLLIYIGSQLLAYGRSHMRRG